MGSLPRELRAAFPTKPRFFASRFVVTFGTGPHQRLAPWPEFLLLCPHEYRRPQRDASDEELPDVGPRNPRNPGSSDGKTQNQLREAEEYNEESCWMIR